MEQELFERLPEALLPWYDQNRRELPWRQDRDPYHIWLSEIMLQQTRVEAVKGYYQRFLQEIPDIKTLSQAEDARLEKLWEGLGYYSRVRNLKKAACRIMELHGGLFPRTHEAVLALPGIGPYTAGAICSIAFGLPTPAVDGNVLRLVSRLTNDPTPIDLPSVKQRAEQALAQIYPERAGDFTQALMELGATLCGPNRVPDCANCPCRTFCLGCRQGTAAQLPVKNPKKKRRREEMTVLILRCGDCFALQRRPENGLLAGLWQFPNFAGKWETGAVIRKVEELGLKPKEILLQLERKHIFTHVEWDMRGVYMEVQEKITDYCWMDAAGIDADAALPTAFRQFWMELPWKV